jgi:prepilin-type N-terminal cleavage/methylation domain-containing protein
MKIKARTRLKSGFTFLEVLIVFTIIVILSVFGVSAYRVQFLKGRDTKRKTDLARIFQAVEEYEKDNNCYPTSLPACGNSFDIYLASMPCDPDPAESYRYVPDTGVPACPRWYSIYAKLENKGDPIIEELGCSLGCGPGNAYNYYVSSPNAP